MTFEQTEPSSKTHAVLHSVRDDFRNGVVLFFEPITLAFKALAYSLRDTGGPRKMATLRALRGRADDIPAPRL